jgi:flagellar assembly factor FliW
MPKFRTVRFGDLQYLETDVIHLPEGLVGMPNLRNWLILEMGDEMPMKWFQSLDRGDFGFPVTQPYLFHDEFDINLTPALLNRLKNKEKGNIAALIITTVHPGGAQVTGNLLAPLVVDTETRRGLQLTLEDSQYGVRQEINYFKFGLAVKSDSSDNADSGNEDASPELDPTETTETAGVTC